MTSPKKVTHPSFADSDQFEAWLRSAISVVGIALLGIGVVFAFNIREGVATTALLAAGFALVIVGYVGRYITRVKFHEFEIGLERATAVLKQVEAEASETLEKLREGSRSYDDIRRRMRPGGRRVLEMEKNLLQAIRLCRKADIDIELLEEKLGSDDLGDRILILAAMKENPDLRRFDIVIHAIENFHKPFDHDRFLVLAADMLGDLEENQVQRLREVVENQRATEKIRPGMIRWLTSERLLRLVKEREEGS